MKYLVGLIFCLFMGVTAISFGGGTLYPPLNHIAQPVVCPGGKMTHQTNVTQGRRNKTLVQTAWTCEEPSGARTPIPALKVALVAGSVYGMGLFALLAALMALGSRGPKGPRQEG